MSHMRSIEIDFDIHKLIETERQNISETPNTVLRRLLQIDKLDDHRSPNESEWTKNITMKKDNWAIKRVARKKGNTIKDSSEVDDGAWSSNGVTLPAGTELLMYYGGKEYLGVIRNSSWLVDGQTYTSPSSAAKGVARTKAGTPPSLNGWKYWKVKRPEDKRWLPLQNLRV